MTVVYTASELLPSRIFTDAVEERSMVRIFNVTKTDTAVPSAINGYEALEYAVGLPQLGDTFVDPLDPAGDSNMVVRRRIARQSQRDAESVLVEIVYWDPTREEGQCALLSDISVQFVDVWRSAPGPTPADYNPSDPDWPDSATPDGAALDIPTIGNVRNDNTDDIAGVSVDIAGIPTSVPRIGGRVIVTEFVQGDEFTPLSYVSYLGTRNSGVYFGYAAGTLVYIGSRILQKRSTGQVQLEHVFAYDELYHLQQIPQRTSGGVVVLNANKQADAVWWRQPFPNYANFLGISLCGATP